VNPMLSARLQRDLVLASTSPRRAAILRMLDFDFETVAAPIAEDEHGLADPEPHVLQLARLKAQAARVHRSHGVLIGADTVVAIGGEILEKPASHAEALAMQKRLRGQWHTVFTGVALVDAATGRHAAAAERTEVHFQAWDDAFLERYVATGEGMDKAGAYAIQGLGALLVREIRGCYFNVMGFPVGCFVGLLERFQMPEATRGD
jgi:septum formation protein